jgi:hypothetical protein
MAGLLLRTEAGCGLTIGRYPRFAYNAAGGGGLGSLGAADSAGWQSLDFDPSGLAIPPLDFRTTRFLGLPLPPCLRIEVVPDQLQGRGQLASGQLELRFRARFRFSLLASYRAPDLLVDVQLSTELASGARQQLRGQRLDARGEALLVGVAQVPPTGEAWYDRFLGLPDEALALLRCRLQLLPAGEPSLASEQPLISP